METENANKNHLSDKEIKLLKNKLLKK